MVYKPTREQRALFCLDDASGYLELIDENCFSVITTSRLALEYSIAKWVAILDLLELGYTVRHDGGMRTCGLCDYYKSECLNCPVCAATGLSGCRGTPQNDFENAKTLGQRCVAAVREVAFLQNLYQEYEEVEQPEPEPVGWSEALLAIVSAVTGSEYADISDVKTYDFQAAQLAMLALFTRQVTRGSDE